MPNRRTHDPIGNYNFRVEIEGVTQGAFKAVEGLDSITDELRRDILVGEFPPPTLCDRRVWHRRELRTGLELSRASQRLGAPVLFPVPVVHRQSQPSSAQSDRARGRGRGMRPFGHAAPCR